MRPRRDSPVSALATLLLACAACTAQAQTAQQGAPKAPASAPAATPAAKPMDRPASQVHPWQVPPPQPGAYAYFTNLQDGARIETPYVLKFGLTGGWGLAPIDVPIGGKSGHHHLLVNRELPLDFQKPLPFNAQYIHFGKGQMETVFNMPPGKYTLRLLLADHQHLPHFVYSPPVQVEVTAQKPGVDPQSLVTKGIALDVGGASVKSPFLLRFHASGFNVGHMAQKSKETGHFRLTLTPQSKGGAPAVMDFRNGQTEVWLAPPKGDYDADLELVDNLRPDTTLAASVPRRITVQ